MKQVKYVCKYCNKAEEYTKIQSLGVVVFQTIVGMLCVFGCIFIIYISLTGLSGVTDMIANGQYAKQSYADFDEIQSLSYDATLGCSSVDTKCYIDKLYNDVSGIRYVPSSDLKPIQSPLFTYNHGGDCKNTAFMFTYMLKSLGIHANMDCSLGEAHCIAVVPLDDCRIVADLTVPMLVQMRPTDDVWDYMSTGKRLY